MPAYPPANEWIEEVREQLSGLTIRERVALAAMQGLLSDTEVDCSADDIAEAAFKMAEAWLAEAQKRREKNA